VMFGGCVRPFPGPGGGRFSRSGGCLPSTLGVYS
jgi:hypothetical protein